MFCRPSLGLCTGQREKFWQVVLGHRQALWIVVQMVVTVEQALEIHDEVVQRPDVLDRRCEPQQESVARCSMVSIR